MAIPWGAIAIGAGSAISGLAGLGGSSSMGKASRHALRRSQKFQKNMWLKAKDIQKPWLNTGEWAVNALQEKVEAGPGEFTKSPGYDFRLQEGVKALERGAAARGNVLSGAQTKALTKFGQDYGSNERTNWLNEYYKSLNPLVTMSGMGQNAAANLAGQAGTMGQTGAGNIMATGNALSNAYANQANVISGAASSGVENYLLLDYLKNKSGRQSAYTGYNSNYLGPKPGY